MIRPFQPTGPEPLVVTKSDAAKMLCICERTLWTLTNEGKIPVVKFGDAKRSSVRYAVDDLRAFIEDRKKIN